MLRSARVFLGLGVRDPVVALSERLRDLPEPAYVAALRAALGERGITFLDVGYDVGRKRRTSGDGVTRGDGDGYDGDWDYWRVYRVRSFVWDDALFVVRPNFAERHFREWPDDLQAVWRDTLVDVPDHRG